MNPRSLYDPYLHHRRSVRLKGYDYSQAGMYFVTICCKDRESRFGSILNDDMVLSEYGVIAYNEWVKLPERFPGCELDVFQIMPDHMHGIIVLSDMNVTDRNVGAGFTSALDNAGDVYSDHHNVTPSRVRAEVNPAPTLGNIISAYKSLTTKASLEITPKDVYMGKIWQRSYFEHVIRNEAAYQNISEYIMTNPAKWIEDKFYH